MNIEAFRLDSPNLDGVARALGSLYQRVAIAKDPMFGWVQIINDVTILGEQLRRNRSPEAASRATKVLMRLLEFVGYYLFIHADSGEHTFADVLADQLRSPSYPDLFTDGPPEGPTRWILAKYPLACSKCGQRPCHCLVHPEVLEERRENPEPYQRFRKDAERAHQALRESRAPSLSLAGMLRMFRDIYRNTYYTQDAWKIGMHLSEELGEATTELSRLELSWRGRVSFDITIALDQIVDYGKAKIRQQHDTLSRRPSADRPSLERLRDDLMGDLDRLAERFRKENPWDVFTALVTERFKEEVADVFSWIAAIFGKLDPDFKVLEQERSRFVNEKAGGAVNTLKCPWCGEAYCSDTCLVTHSVSSEIIERLVKM